MKSFEFSPEEIVLFKQKAFEWAVSFETACYFDSNSYSDRYSAFDALIAAGSRREVSSSESNAFELLDLFLQEKRWALGFLGYDLKNSLEDLSSSNQDHTAFPDLYFFEPIHLIQIKGTSVHILSEDDGESLLKEIRNFVPVKEQAHGPVPAIQARFNFTDYCSAVEQIKDHIRRGDIYEMNFCQEFYSEQALIDPVATYQRLKAVSPTPFSSFIKTRDNYILSASPERFLCRRGSQLISQPIKGTAKRSRDQREDDVFKQALRNDEKEQSENVMIVDLVRNDLTRCSVQGSVKVEELFGIYSFAQVHQMISTVVSDAAPAASNVDILKATFPMGSMTGAPKVSAMNLIEKFERSKRGVYSGAAGYFSPDGNFDFNVVIRTILYNSAQRYLSFQVGSAITYACEPAAEYEECLLKAEAILKVLSEDK